MCIQFLYSFRAGCYTVSVTWIRAGSYLMDSCMLVNRWMDAFVQSGTNGCLLLFASMFAVMARELPIFPHTGITFNAYPNHRHNMPHPTRYGGE